MNMTAACEKALFIACLYEVVEGGIRIIRDWTTISPTVKELKLMWRN